MFKEELELVPTKPGSYQMYDKNDIVIYVGKAKNLKRRLSSYFNRTQTGKTAELVKNIAYFKYIVTNTELESFILEINLKSIIQSIIFYLKMIRVILISNIVESLILLLR